LVARENGPTHKAHSLSPTRTLVTPYCKRIRPGHRTTRRSWFPLAGFPPFVFRLAPTNLGWDTQRQFTRRSRDPPGSKRRHLARQVGACCVLTNSFPSSSRWVVSSNHSNPGRCSVSGVFCSCPSTVATTCYSFLRRATTTMAAVSPPAGGGIDDVFPTWRKSNIQVCPVTFPVDGGGRGAGMAKQEATPRRLSSESMAPAPQWGTRRALTSRLRRRRASFPRNTPTLSRRTTPARSRRTCWALASYLRQRCSLSLMRLRHQPSIKRYRPFPIPCLLDSAATHQATPLQWMLS
jgi:hypothetical protein